jgi:toxin ParE1/3/4
MLPILVTEQAEADLADILEYLEERSPAAAERLATAIDQRGQLLAEFPKMGRVREELAPGLRSVAIEQYLLFYRVTESAVEILRILHGARDIESIMKAEDAPP